MDVAWYWIALPIIATIFIIFITIKVVLANPKRRKVAKSVFGGR